MVRQGEVSRGAKNYCDKVKEGLKNIPWLNLPPPKAMVDLCIDIFEKHRKSACKCTFPSSDCLILASGYFYSYLLQCEQFRKDVDQVLKSSEDDQGLSLVPHLVNETQERTLLIPLKNCIRILFEVLVPGFRPSFKLLESVKVHEILKCSYHIFSCHRSPKYQILCAVLLIKYHELCKDLEVIDGYLDLHLLMGYHFYIQALLDLGMLDKAQKKFQQAKVHLDRVKASKSLKGHVECCWLCIDELELALRSNQQESIDFAVKELDKLINSATLKQRRASRMSLKLQVYLLLSQLPSSYNFLKNYEEFIDSHALIRSCLIVWHQIFWMPKQNGAEDLHYKSAWAFSIEENSVRFSIYDLSLRILQSVYQFHSDVGSGPELQTTFKALLAICRDNCYLQWALRLILINFSPYKCEEESKNEYFLMHREILTSLMWDNSKGSLAKKPSESVCKTRLQTRKKVNPKPINLDQSIEEIDDCGSEPNEPDECLHDKFTSIHQVEMVLRRNCQPKKIDDFKCSPEALDLEAFKTLSYPLCLFYLEAYAKTMFLSSHLDSVITKKLEKTLNNLPNQIRKSFEDFKDQLKLELCFNSQSDAFYFRLELVSLLAEQNNYNLDHLRSLVFETLKTIPPKTLMMHYHLSNCFLRLIHRIASMHITEQFHSPEYVIYQPSQVRIESKSSAVFKTPSPVKRAVTNTKSRRVPRAPDRNDNFKMPEFKDYIVGLKSNIDNSINPKSENCGDKQAIELFKFTEELSRNIDQTDVDSTPKFRVPIERVKKKTQPKVKKANQRQAPKKSPDIPQEEIEVIDLENSISQLSLQDDISCSREPYLDIIHSWEVGEIDLSQISSKLEQLLTLVGNRAPLELYSKLNESLFIANSSSKIKNRAKAIYHMTESIQNLIRYRALFTSLKKERHNIETKFPVHLLSFGNADASSLEHLMSKVPFKWRLILCQSLENGTKIPDLLIIRLQKGTIPIILKIKTDGEKFTTSFMSELAEILSLSSATIKERNPATFLETRMALNTRLSLLLKSFDETWLGPFRGMFLGQSDNPDHIRLCDKLISTISSHFGSTTCMDDQLLGVVVDSFLLLSEDQFKTALSILYPDASSKHLEDCSVKCQKLTNSIESGDRLKYEAHARNPIGLILSPSLEGFPFESIPIVSDTQQQVFRIPSLRFLTAMITLHKLGDTNLSHPIDSKEAFFVLNPDNDLPRTEARFKAKFQNQKTWHGCIGEKPDPGTFCSEMAKKDLYIYFGHGSGSSIYNAAGWEKLDIKPVSLIVGCSSGRLHCEYKHNNSNGNVHKFLIHGCPAYLGLLWDVTDGDIDKYANKMLSHLIEDWENGDPKDEHLNSLLSAMLSARSACRLNAATAGAAVLYGLPVKFEK
ncbi:extra spindle pole bodies like 1, separase [Brevipalpus obovatus]|uniref:extra spindle pole bodies like 1, separase n=1 Tax=Brevipalpus obovatus TaxID=246614 RepID=UPI003D9FA82A